MSSVSALLAALAVQAAATLIDEFGFHYHREVPRWERWGHPLDTLTTLAPFLVMALVSPGGGGEPWVAALMLFSCGFVTKDEWVHARLCGGGESWLHALLFILHPTIYLLAWIAWQDVDSHPPFMLVAAAMASYCAYQLLFWNLIEPAYAASAPAADNTIYEEYGERWYTAHDDPVALLRAEARTKNPWVKGVIRSHFPARAAPSIQVLDVGCGAGFLANDLAQARFQVTGVDLSPSSLMVARAHDHTHAVDYIQADAYRLPFADASFDVVTCMDFLEHVEDPSAIVREISRVLRPEGLFVFHTFNRNWLAGLVIIRGVEWFVKNTPPALHVLRLFLKPEEVAGFCRDAGLASPVFRGIAPDPLRRAFWQMLWTREVPPGFRFKLVRSTRLAYLGHAAKRP